jgi:hypothetical protein
MVSTSILTPKKKSFKTEMKIYLRFEISHTESSLSHTKKWYTWTYLLCLKKVTRNTTETCGELQDVSYTSEIAQTWDISKIIKMIQ